MKRLPTVSFRTAPAALAATLGVIALTATLTPETGMTGRLDLADAPPGALGVHVAFQLADCASTLAFLEILDHPSLLGRVSLASLVFLGEARDTAAAARALGGTGKGRPLIVASAATRRALQRLGFRRTPFFVVEDADGVVRFASPVPAGPRQLRALHGSLRALADLETHRARSAR
jgi:hypothetical protein